MATDAQRDHIAAIWHELIALEGPIHYRQKRPMTLTHYLEQQLIDLLHNGHSVDADCSETVTAICKMAGLADPSGRGYDGYGNSATMWDHLPRYSTPSRAQVGAIVTFGPGGADHVAQVIQAGKDPVLGSHGQEKGPMAVRFSAQKHAHRAPATFLSIARL